MSLKAKVSTMPMPAGGFGLYGMTPVEYTKHLLTQMGITSCLVDGSTSLDPDDPLVRLDEWIEVYWAEDGVEEETLAGTTKFPGFYYGQVKHYPATMWEPDEYDFEKEGETRSLTSAIRWAILRWVAHTIDQHNQFFGEKEYYEELRKKEEEF